MYVVHVCISLRFNPLMESVTIRLSGAMVIWSRQTDRGKLTAGNLIAEQTHRVAN
jgi:hypothetical protein